MAGSREWLAHPPITTFRHAQDRSPRLLVSGAETPRRLPQALQEMQTRCPEGTSCVLLALGIGEAAGHLSGLCRTPRGLEPLDSLEVVGPGLVSVALSSDERLRRRLAPYPVTQPSGPNNRVDKVDSGPSRSSPGAVPTEEPHAPTPYDLWSRTIGALGKSTWRRLASLEVAIVGVGRTGSLAAQALTRLGVHSLTLVDPDTLEAGNVGEMAQMRPQDIGKHKVEALAEALRSNAPYTSLELTTRPVSILSFSALAALKRADLVFCCVDNPAARIVTQMLSTFYLRPLIDIGTGIIRGELAIRTRRRTDATARENPPRSMGADVRLLLPGRCLRCYGGIADFEAGRARLLAPDVSSTPNDSDWRMHRSGSLHALNTAATGLAVLLLTELVSGRLAQSSWLHLAGGADGLPRLESPMPPAVICCSLCALSGYGDAAIDKFADLLRTLR